MSAQVLANLAGWVKTFKDVNIPAYQDVSVQKAQAEATAGNLADLPGQQQIGTLVNKYNFDELQKMFALAAPERAGLLKQEAGITKSELAGEITKPEMDAMLRSSGYQSYASGFAGTPIAGAKDTLGIRDAVQKRIEAGFNHFDAWQKSVLAGIPKPYDVTMNFVDPKTQYLADVNERNNRWNYDFLKAQQAAMPKGWERALTGLTDWVENIGASAATMGIGGGMGGGGKPSDAGGNSILNQSSMTMTSGPDYSSPNTGGWSPGDGSMWS